MIPYTLTPGYLYPAVDIIIPTCQSALAIAPQVCEIEGFSPNDKIIKTCEPVSAAKNRNIGLNHATTDIVIMVDDDIFGFYEGWMNDLIRPLLDDKSIVYVSARLVHPDGSNAPMMFQGESTGPYCDVPRAPTAAIAFRNDGIRFDENFIGSGYEDDDFCIQIKERYPSGRFIINNKCRLIHANEQKNQHGKYAEHNQAYFEKKWKGRREGAFSGIPQIIHFVWVGPDMPRWAAENIERFCTLNPGFQIRIHNESSLLPEFKDAYDRINHPQHTWSMRSDLIRASVLKRYGGWYFDVDFFPLVPVRRICEDIRLSGDQMLFFASADRQIVANGVLACRPESAGINHLVAVIKAKICAKPEWWDYGTWCCFAAHKDHPELYVVADAARILPIAGKKEAVAAAADPEEQRRLIAKGAYAIHHHMQDSLTLES